MRPGTKSEPFEKYSEHILSLSKAAHTVYCVRVVRRCVAHVGLWSNVRGLHAKQPSLYFGFITTWCLCVRHERGS